MDNTIITNLITDLTELKIKNSQLENRVKKLEDNVNKNITQNKNLEILTNGFELDKQFINNCLFQHSMQGDFNLIKEYYLKDNLTLRFENNNIEYYFDNKWNNNNDELINLIIMNIVNTYLTIMQNQESTETLLNEEEANYNYIFKIQKIQKYKKDLIKLLKDNLNN